MHRSGIWSSIIANKKKLLEIFLLSCYSHQTYLINWIIVIKLLKKTKKIIFFFYAFLQVICTWIEGMWGGVANIYLNEIQEKLNSSQSFRVKCLMGFLYVISKIDVLENFELMLNPNPNSTPIVQCRLDLAWRREFT